MIAHTVNYGDNMVWVLALNKYQRDNLLFLLNLVYGKGLEPFSIMNNGDWVGEISMMLGKPAGYDFESLGKETFEFDPKTDRANMSREEVERRVKEWKQRT